MKAMSLGLVRAVRQGGGDAYVGRHHTLTFSHAGGRAGARARVRSPPCFQTLDEVDGFADVTWVQPRILSREQIASLASRLHNWSDSVSSLVTTMRGQAPELFLAQ